MKIKIDNVPYWDDGVYAGVKTILERNGFGLEEIHSGDRVIMVDIYSHPTDNETATLIGCVTRNFGHPGLYQLYFDRVNSPNQGTAKRVAKVVSDLIVF